MFEKLRSSAVCRMTTGGAVVAVVIAIWAGVNGGQDQSEPPTSEPASAQATR